MKYLFLLLSVLIFSQVSFAQSTYPIRADTTRLYRVGGYNELKLENSTMNVKGQLSNIGNGIMKNVRPYKHLDSLIWPGVDTVTGFSSAPGTAGTSNYDSVLNRNGLTRTSRGYLIQGNGGQIFNDSFGLTFRHNSLSILRFGKHQFFREDSTDAFYEIDMAARNYDIHIPDNGDFQISGSGGSYMFLNHGSDPRNRNWNFNIYPPLSPYYMIDQSLDFRNIYPDDTRGELEYIGSHLYFQTGRGHVQLDNDTTGGAGFSNPMTTNGDIIAQIGGSPGRIGIGTSGQVLTVSGGYPSWQTPSTGSSALSALSDVTLTSPVNGDYLKYNGSKWVNTPLPTGTDNLDVILSRGGGLSANRTSQMNARTWELDSGTIIYAGRASGYSTIHRPTNYLQTYTGGTTASAAGQFSQGWATFPGVNAPDPRPNVVGMMWGYNVDVGGAPVIPGESSFRFGTETYYRQSGTSLMEFHLPEIADEAGVLHRIHSTYVDRSHGFSYDQNEVNAVEYYTQNRATIPNNWYSFGVNSTGNTTMTLTAAYGSGGATSNGGDGSNAPLIQMIGPSGYLNLRVNDVDSRIQFNRHLYLESNYGSGSLYTPNFVNLTPKTANANGTLSLVGSGTLLIGNDNADIYISSTNFNTASLGLDTYKWISTKTKSYSSSATIADDDHTVYIDASGITMTMQTAVYYNGYGKEYVFANRSTGNATLAAASGETIDGASSLIIPAGGKVKIQSDNTQWTTLYKSGFGSAAATTSPASGTTLAADGVFISHGSSLNTYPLPASASEGQVFIVLGEGTGGWKISQNSGQKIVSTSNTTTTGTGGYVTSGSQYSVIVLRCIVANTTFEITGQQGSINYN